jgi:lysozyme
MDKALQIIKNYESLHDGDLKAIGLQPKMCPAGVWTIGWGRAIIDPATGKFLRGPQGKARALELYPALTVKEADAMLLEDYTMRELAVNELLKRKAEPHELGAMVSLAYNIGLANFRNSSVLRYFNSGQKKAAADAFLLWNKAGGKVLTGLSCRRHSERYLFLHNEVKLFAKHNLPK